MNSPAKPDSGDSWPVARTPAAFWRHWSRWRHGEPGAGNFADVMRVLRLHESFVERAIIWLDRESCKEITVLDLGCGAAQLAGPLARALRAADCSLRHYVGIDFADPDWMPLRVAREFRLHGLEDRSRYIHHDLANGLPVELPTNLEPVGTLLITSCWGMTYLQPDRLVTLLRQCTDFAQRWPGGAILYVNMLTAGQFDRNVLTRRFLGEVVPRQIWIAVRNFDIEPLVAIRNALRALPRMREFAAELKEVANLMPLSVFLDVVHDAGLEPLQVDASSLWGQTTSIVVRLQAPK
jgi:SAM-dependent methyltransferase